VAWTRVPRNLAKESRLFRTLRVALAGAALMTALTSTAAFAATDYYTILPANVRPLPAVERVAPSTRSVRNAQGYALPLDGRLRVTTPFGERGPYWKLGYHPGIDFGVKSGTPVKAVADGVVLEAHEAGYNAGYGGYVKIDHGNGVHSLYAHLSRVDVAEGQQVSAGEALALSGNTGVSTGPHLHVEIRKNGVHQDPAPYLGL
jgi:murein DD-endopeptidase MepM/ murein hydrolase activator NlpD